MLTPAGPLKTKATWFRPGKLTDSNRSGTGNPAHVTVTESKHSALFKPVLPVCPSSQSVMFVPVATIFPLNETQVLPVTLCDGLRSIAVGHEADAEGLTLTVQVEYNWELPRIQPEMM